MLTRLLLALWSALLPAVEREQLRQRLGYELPTVPVSWALAAAQLALSPLWAVRALAYTSAYAEAGVTQLLNTPLKDLDRQAEATFVGSPLYFLSYFFTLEGLLMEYAIFTGVFRVAALVGSGRPVGDPLISFAAWMVRVAWSKARESGRLRQLGPERPDRIRELPDGGLQVLSFREKLDWNERVTIQFGDDLYRLTRVEERPRGKWTDIAYVLRPQEPGEIIRAQVRLEGRVEKGRTASSH